MSSPAIPSSAALSLSGPRHRRSPCLVGPPVGFVLIGLLLAGCAARAAIPSPERDPSLFAVTWVQTAAEYEAAAEQAFAAAARSLELALADASWTAAPEQTGAYGALPPAVILDVDETVLDNTPFQARLIEEGDVFDPENWGRWVGEAAADPVPGALEFTRLAARSGVEIFYITNRDAELESPTRRNLERLGFPLADEPDVLLTRGERPEWGSDKESRRSWVAERYRVLVLVGDDLNDFVSGARADRAARKRLLDRLRGRWGREWILVPNPMYGSWQPALGDFPEGALDELDRKRPPGP